MQPIEFPQQTDVLAKDQPQYRPIPVHVGSKEDNFPMTCCFELSVEEVAEIIATRKLWYTQVTFGNRFQPVMLSTQNPFEKGLKCSRSPIEALVSALTNDADYRETWKANIAMAYQDAYLKLMPETVQVRKELLHSVANHAADNFLNLLCSTK